MAKPQSLTLSRKAVDLTSAALRHVRDAESLLSSSPDQAYYLAGYGPECARKASSAERWLDQAIGHAFGALADDMLGFAASIDPLARRYDPLAYVARYPALARWTVDVRYVRTGTFTREQAKALCQDAREAVDAVTIALWADGRFPDGESLW